MTDQQPYQPYQGHQQHQQHQQHQGHQPQQGYQDYQGSPAHQGYDQPEWPGQQQAQAQAQAQAQTPAQAQGYDDPDPQAHLQYTQQWQGQTWETSVQPPVTAADPARTAYGNPQSAYGDYADGYAPDGNWQQQAPLQAQQPSAYTPPAPAPPQAQAPVQAPAPATGGTAATYGPATLAGNARITDAQRARLEGRSPIIEPGMQPAALTALLGLLLSGTAAIGSYALLVPLVVLQAVTAAGWFRLNGMWPARQGIALAFLGALVSDVALLVAGRENAPAAILGSLGVWVLLCLVLQLRSHADPDERMYGLMATVASSALAILATGHLGAEPDAVTVGAAAVAVAVLARALPLPTPASVVVALLAAAGAGIAVGQMTGLGAKGALLGAGAAVCALIGHRVASYDYPSRFVHFTAGVALPLAAAAPAVYVLGRALA
ncbi:hypothetical protein [Streptomyces sp. 3214.6]|uniref:hypothetical protein n=1 Tax=Streptomyces sp. 3214.6 TaxID=1882757 RepID=UPI00090B5DA4|nr:hypothetical protein [Streptomyces sp. 3214.6]SHI17423.1 Uncharacterized membrane protein YfcA [Streptomyces sp. 3214.6]